MGRHAIKSKEKIVDTCTKLFWKQGYKNTSVKDIEVAKASKRARRTK